MSIYEITQKISDNSVIKGDVNHAADLIKSMINEKYITPIQQAIAAENEKARTNPSREARLLDAIKPFVDARQHDALDRTIDTIYLMQTLQGLRRHMPQQQAALPVPPHTDIYAAAHDPSIHNDGIYDIDDRCVEQHRHSPLMPIFVMLAMASTFRPMP